VPQENNTPKRREKEMTTAAAIIRVATNDSDRLKIQIEKIMEFSQSWGGESIEFVFNLSDTTILDTLVEIRDSKVGRVYVLSAGILHPYMRLNMALLALLDEMHVDVVSVNKGSVVTHDEILALIEAMRKQVLADAVIERGTTFYANL
jgi:hypothetical protein